MAIRVGINSLGRSGYDGPSAADGRGVTPHRRYRCRLVELLAKFFPTRWLRQKGRTMLRGLKRTLAQLQALLEWLATFPQRRVNANERD